MDSLNIGNVERIIIQQMNNSHVLYSFPSLNELLSEIKFRNNMIESAKEMNQSEAGFTTFKYARCNTEYWNLTTQGGFLLKHNILPSDAIRDIYRNSSLYAFECATACVIIFYHALLKSIGKKAFNFMFQNLYLYSWHTDPDLGLQTFYSDHFIPGDVVYFKNPDYNPATPWFRGVNAVAMTEGKLFGHGFGIKTDKEMIHSLNEKRKKGSNVSAYLTNLVTRLTFYNLTTNKKTDYRKQQIVVHHNKSSISYEKYWFYLYKVLNS